MFNAIALAYDLLAADPARLARELPFLERRIPAGSRVLDLACGTGVHAAALARYGCLVTASDLSPEMLAVGRARRDHPALVWHAGDLRQPPAGPFDRVLILGNSLNLLPGRPAVGEALRAIHNVLVPGGLLVVQIINQHPTRIREPRQLVRQATVEGDGLVIVKSLVPHPAGTLLSLTAHRHRPERDDQAGHWTHASDHAVLLDLTATELDALVDAAGYTVSERLGDLSGSAYDPAHAADLVLVVRA